MYVAIPSDKITFDASAKTITMLGDYATIEREQIVSIVDLTTGDTIYNSDNSNKFNISVSSGVITHTYSNDDQADTDAILVVYASMMVNARSNIYAQIENGLVFRNYHKFTIASAADAEILIKVGSKYPFMFLEAEADGDTNISIYRAPTITADGTTMNSGNFNFNSLRTVEIELYHTPTLSADGTYIANTDILGGSGVGTPAAAKASASMKNLDVILEPNINYMIRFDNNAEREIQVKFETTFIEKDAISLIL